jgi:3-hydroxyisobutyrate dehydrogenase
VNVAVLGTGIMGGAMARRAAAAGMPVTAWSRPLEDARRLERDGVRVVETPREAAMGADVAVTMAPDAAAIESFATGDGGFLAAAWSGAQGVVNAGGAAARGPVWAQCATVGLDGCERLAALAAEAEVAFVDSPVLGTKEPAERGELVVLASGADDTLDRCAPLFEAIGRRTLRLGAAGAGTRLKLVTNDWIVGCVAVLAEAMALADALGVDGGVFLDAIAGSPVDMGYAQAKGRMILDGAYPASMPLAHAAKDARLAAEAAERHGLPHIVTRAAAELLERGAKHGDAGADMAAAFRAAAERGARR